jgi:hypothetical protein
MFLIECFDGRFSTDRAAVGPKTKDKGWDWAALPLGLEADRGYPMEDDPQLLAALDKLRTHPLMAGLRIRFRDDKVKPIKPKPKDGDVTSTFMEGDGTLDPFVSGAV